MSDVKCVLCNKTIDNYSSDFNHLVISESRSVDVCKDCIDKFVNWRRVILCKLFPTKAGKRFLEKN
ncbi:MAG TPA: hypothetical protein VI790_05515 [Candidatus Nanoarchaeia archaeon]|nr:hypothetical protein [Candidatus Nanoarchaeia archaeon]